MRGESDVENNRAWKCCVVGNIVRTRIDENGILSCSEFPDNSFFVLNFVEKWNKLFNEKLKKIEPRGVSSRLKFLRICSAIFVNFMFLM